MRHTIFKIVRKHFAQPCFLNLGHEGKDDLRLTAAAFDLVDLGSDNKPAVLRDTRARQLSATAVNDITNERASTSTASNLIRKSRQNTPRDGLVLCRA